MQSPQKSTDQVRSETRRRPIPLLLTPGVRYVVVPALLLILGGWGVGLSEPSRLAALSGLLIAYVGIEILYERFRRPSSWLMTPPTLTSIASLAIPFALTNGVFYGSAFGERIFRKGADFVWINKAVSLAILGSLCMWIGYRWSLGRRFSEKLKAWIRRWGGLNSSYRPSYVAVGVGIVLSTVTRYLMVQNGVYGRLGLATPPPQISMYLNWIQGLGTLSLFLLSIDFFSSRHHSGEKGAFFLLIFLNEILWGLLSGFKSQVIMPVIVVGIGYAAVRKRIPTLAVATTVGFLFLAYALVQPFRRAIGDNAFDRTSVGSAVTVLADIAVSGGRYRREAGSAGGWTETIMEASARQNFAGPAAVAIRYEDTQNPRREVEQGKPKLNTILTSPIRAVIPRILWPDKPSVTDIGRWFRIYPYKGPVDSSTSVGMSIIGYLYFAGGMAAIAVCFLILGLIQRTAFETLLPFGGGGLLIYMGVLSVVAQLPTTFDAVIIGTIRKTVLLYMVQYIFIKE